MLEDGINWIETIMTFKRFETFLQSLLMINEIPTKQGRKACNKGSRSYKPCLLSQQSRLLHRNGRKCKSKKKLLVSSCDQISKILKIPKEAAKPPCRNRAFSADKLCPNK